MTPVTVIPYQRRAPMVGASGPERRAARQAGSATTTEIVGVTTRCLVEGAAAGDQDAVGSADGGEQLGR
jgi:hypothetical protein